MMSMSATRALARPATTDASSARARARRPRRSRPAARSRLPPASFVTPARARLAVSTVTRAAIFQNAAAKQQAVARLEAQLTPAAAAGAAL